MDRTFHTDGCCDPKLHYVVDETDHQTGMDIPQMAGMIYEYTSGYPYLVSRFCSDLDGLAAQTGAFPDKSSVWTWEMYNAGADKMQ